MSTDDHNPDASEEPLATGDLPQPEDDAAPQSAIAPKEEVDEFGFSPDELVEEEDEDEGELDVSPIEEFVDEEAVPVEDEEIEMRWYILKVQVNRETTICDQLKRRVKLAGLERYFADILVPTEDVREFTKAGSSVSSNVSCIQVTWLSKWRSTMTPGSWSERRRELETSPGLPENRPRYRTKKSNESWPPRVLMNRKRAKRKSRLESPSRLASVFASKKGTLKTPKGKFPRSTNAMGESLS